MEIANVLRGEGYDVLMSNVYYLLRGQNRRRSQNVTTTDVESVCKELESSSRLIVRRTVDVVNMRVLATNAEMIRLIGGARTLHVDCTFKLIDISYPIIVIGFTDNTGCFFLTCLGIIYGESADAYSWCFKQLIEICAEHAVVLRPSAIVGDGASAITSAVSAQFPGCLRINCWAHVFRNIELIVRALPVGVKASILSDFKFVQEACTLEMFNAARVLFVEKWSQVRIVEAKLALIIARHLTHDASWYEGYAIFSPSTNNALERFNLTLKRTYSDRQRLSVTEYIRRIREILENETLKLKTKPPCLDRMAYGSPDVLNTEGLEVEELDSTFDAVRYIVYRASKCPTSRLSEIRIAICQMQFESLSAMQDAFDNVHVVHCKRDLNCHRDLFCSCIAFVKHKACADIATVLNQLHKSHLIRRILLSARRRPGRPRRGFSGALSRD